MLAVQMDTIPFHWDTMDAPQCLRITCLCPDEFHEGWLCRKLLCFTCLLATGSAAYHFRQRRSRHRSRNKRPPAAEDQALRGARLKALLAVDFCLFAWSFVEIINQVHICGAARVFHPCGNFSVAVRANLTVNMPLRILVGVHRVSP